MYLLKANWIEYQIHIKRKYENNLPSNYARRNDRVMGSSVLLPRKQYTSCLALGEKEKEKTRKTK